MHSKKNLQVQQVVLLCCLVQASLLRPLNVAYWQVHVLQMRVLACRGRKPLLPDYMTESQVQHAGVHRLLKHVT